MTWAPYEGDEYWDFNALLTWCRALAVARPQLVRIEELGESLEGRPLILLTLALGEGELCERPAVWLDGGTHASEWAGVMATLYALSQWVGRVDEGDEALTAWLREHAVFVMPCISPDGYQALFEGAPFLRSCTRPPREGVVRSGWDPGDMDGDGVVRFMRWAHPAGAFVIDESDPRLMRPRRLEDSPERAYFFAREGSFVNWDGVRWTAAPRRHGLDLNRNFPGSWAPFSMFGMDSGAYPLSAPESRAVVDAFAARTCVGVAITNHTYTGAILTQPYRKDTPLAKGDIDLMRHLAGELVTDTGYKVYKTYPDFAYDPKKAVVGVWSDTISTVFGVPGYTLELWDPFGAAGLSLDKPAEFFNNPDPEMVLTMLKHFATEPQAFEGWRPFEHPQLGSVEIGGLDYYRTVRNPPLAELAAECERAFKVVDRARLALPRVRAELRHERLGESLHRLTLVLCNEGFLATSGLAHGETVGAAPGTSATLELGEGLSVCHGATARSLPHLDGWSGSRIGFQGHPLYPRLQARGQVTEVSWTLSGTGSVAVHWHAGRGGTGCSRRTL